MLWFPFEAIAQPRGPRTLKVMLCVTLCVTHSMSGQQRTQPLSTPSPVQALHVWKAWRREWTAKDPALWHFFLCAGADPHSVASCTGQWLAYAQLHIACCNMQCLLRVAHDSLHRIQASEFLPISCPVPSTSPPHMRPGSSLHELPCDLLFPSPASTRIPAALLSPHSSFPFPAQLTY